MPSRRRTVAALAAADVVPGGATTGPARRQTRTIRRRVRAAAGRPRWSGTRIRAAARRSPDARWRRPTWPRPPPRGREPPTARVGDGPTCSPGDCAPRGRSTPSCVTAGAEGAFLAASGADTHFFPAPRVRRGATPAVPAIASPPAPLSSLGRGGLTSEAVARGVADASAWVGAGGSACFRAVRLSGARAVGSRVPQRTQPVPARAAGGDPGGTRRPAAGRRHPGRHRRLLRHRARRACRDPAGRPATGRRLVVLINSDASVARLKGPGRPVVTPQDRARVLEAFDCVDAVAVFDEDDPAQRCRGSARTSGSRAATTAAHRCRKPRPSSPAAAAWSSCRTCPAVDDQHHRALTLQTDQNRSPDDRPTCPTRLIESIDEARQGPSTNTTTGPRASRRGRRPRTATIGIVYVTGGSSGLGAAVVAAVAAAGGTPAVIDRVPPASDVPYVLADLADSAAAAAAVEPLVETVGRPRPWSPRPAPTPAGNCSTSTRRPGRRWSGSTCSGPSR